MAVTRKFKTESAGEFSETVVRIAKLPHGTYVTFFNTKTDRVIRSDKLFKRLRLTRQSAEGATADEATVKALLGWVTSRFCEDLASKHIKLRLHAPDGTIIPGNTKLRKVRSMKALPNKLEKSAFAKFVNLIEDVDTDLTIEQTGLLFNHINSRTGSSFSEWLVGLEE